jgi:hypothetical protein
MLSHVSSKPLFRGLDNCLSIAFSLVLLSIAAILPLTMFDGLMAQSLVEVLSAAALAFVAGSARAADVNFAAQATRRLKLAAAVPVIWMIIQLLPMPFPGMSHSIWINADEALNQRSFGHISIDIGKTIEALIFYAANITLMIVSMFVARDRRRAELALFSLAATASLTTVVLIILDFVPVGSLAAGETTEMLAAVSSLGAILSVATGTCAIERGESRRPEPDRKAPNTRMTLALAIAGLLVCIAGLAVSVTLNVGLVVAFGVITFGSIQAIRRFGLTGWATVIFVATMVIAATMIVFWRYNSGGSLSPFLAFATAASPQAISVAQRILSDTNWLGTGAGTYAPLLPIYQELGSTVTRPPSTAAAFAIELGWPAVVFAFLFSIGIIATLYRGALNRGRDSFYPAAAAACAIIVLGEAFCDASLLHSCVAVLGDTVIGLGLAQHISGGDSN